MSRACPCAALDSREFSFSGGWSCLARSALSTQSVARTIACLPVSDGTALALWQATGFAAATGAHAHASAQSAASTAVWMCRQAERMANPLLHDSDT